MNKTEFVDLVTRLTCDSAVRGVLSQLEKPQGRVPSRETLELAEWYSHLGESDRENLRRVMLCVGDSACFGFLAVLDGVRNSGVESYELYAVSGSAKVHLTDDTGYMLHELFKSWPERMREGH